MVVPVMANRTINAVIVDVNLSLTHSGEQFVKNIALSLIGCCSKKFPWQLLPVQCRFQNSGCARYVNAKYTTLPQEVQVTPKPKHRLTVQIDEQESFVNDKDQEQWVWLAMDANTREIVGCYIGDRSGKSAGALWDSLPAVYRQCAVCYTDFWSSYPVVLPSKRHRAVGKDTGLTSYPIAIQLHH